ncbi:transposase [Shewanella donghaensis]|uniref:transposase n=1 Tax=Shewanella donghaensis TaxID=238836 RepID=UPI001182E37E|nr:transposase [Shewanella donghaensis]
MSAQTKIYSADFQQQVVAEVKQNNRLISDVAKQYYISAKTVYQWVKKKDTANISNVNFSSNKSIKEKQKSVLVSEITHLQLKIAQLNQQLLSISANP